MCDLWFLGMGKGRGAAEDQEIDQTLVAVMTVVAFGAWWILRPRKTKTYYGQTFEDRSHDPVVATQNEPKTPMSRGARIYGIGFMTVWLTGWTFGCYLAFGTWMMLEWGEEGSIFLLVWLSFAIPAWFLAAWTLVRLIRGDDVDIEFGDGDGGGD